MGEPDYAHTELRLPSGTRIKLDPYRYLFINPHNEDLQMVLDQTVAFLESLSDEPLLALGTIPNVPVSALAACDPILFRTPSGRKVTQKAPGRPTFYNDELDKRLARDWEAAKGMKVKKREFARTCHARGFDGETMPEKEIFKAIDRGQYKLKRPRKARE